ncbi:helix-turn-helix domain-containing protein [Teichococcus aestuarii]|uniref:helix-turn-helix domain-containing protein n=1 Tax=Teichococcus aestuarii TaxID=568898 RepID=UPI0036199B9D
MALNCRKSEISSTEIGDTGLLSGFQACCALTSAAMNIPGPDPREVEFYEGLAFRFKLAVEAVSESKAEIAEELGISSSRLSNWINAVNAPDWFMIHKFCKRYGVSADWILLGDMGSLRHDLANSLARAQNGGAKPQRGRRQVLKKTG